MGLYPVLSVGIGAAVGAWLRWGFGLWLNPVLPALPLGTLTANLFGGYLMGLAMVLLTRHAWLTPEAALLLTTILIVHLGFSSFWGLSSSIAEQHGVLPQKQQQPSISMRLRKLSLLSRCSRLTLREGSVARAWRPGLPARHEQLLSV